MTQLPLIPETPSETQPRPGSRADRMRKPLAKDALKQLADHTASASAPSRCAAPTPPPA